jgi:hypothetical protein
MAIVCAEQLTSAIALDGHAFVRASDVHELLTANGPLADWRAFASSWNDLELDHYMADGGRYRRRRHAVYAAAAGGTIVRGPNEPHYQSRDYNALNGGIARWFAPVGDSIGSGATMTAIRHGRAPRSRAWPVPRLAHRVHQFWIAARPGEEAPDAGRDPSGRRHHVLVLLIERHNIASGTTTVHRLDGHELGAFTLTSPLDAALLTTRRSHTATPIEPVDPSELAYRDVLVCDVENTRADYAPDPTLAARRGAPDDFDGALLSKNQTPVRAMLKLCSASASDSAGRVPPYAARLSKAPAPTPHRSSLRTAGNNRPGPPHRGMMRPQFRRMS